MKMEINVLVYKKIQYVFRIPYSQDSLYLRAMFYFC